MAIANINIADFIKEGSNITFTTSDEGRIITIAASGSGGGHTIQDEGTPLTARANLNFVGSAVAVTDDSGNNATVVTISGGTITVGDTQVLYADGANNPTGEASFTYNKTTNKLTVDEILLNGKTASELLATDGSKNIVSLAVATYPSLTELSYVKGVTSAIQTQINTKAPTASPTFTGTPAAPTASAGTNTTQLATTEFVQQVAVWRPLPTMTRTDGDTFTIPDTSNAGNWDKKLDRLTVIKWTDTTVHVAIVKSSSYSSNVVTVEIAGDTLDNTFTTTSGYYTTIPVTKVTFAIAGTMATGTDLSRKFYADVAYRVLMGRANHGTAGTTNATTYDINKNGSTVFTTKLSVSSADTTGDDTSANNDTSLALDDYVTVDCDSISTTAPIDAYIDLYLFPTNRIYL